MLAARASSCGRHIQETAREGAKAAGHERSGRTWTVRCAENTPGTDCETLTFAWRKEVADLLAKGDFFPFDSRERSAPQSGDFAATENSLLLKITRVPLRGLRRSAGAVFFDRLLRCVYSNKHRGEQLF